MAAKRNEEAILENKLLRSEENQYGIYQLKDTEETRAYRFMNMDFVERHGFSVYRENYQLVYVDSLKGNEDLEGIYSKFNLERPKDFIGHSLSVSDIVLFQKEGKITAYYVDSFGFVTVPNFLEQEMLKEKESQLIQTAKIEYYVAECEEFHTMGEYKEGLNLQEAVSLYHEIWGDPSRRYYGNAMGFILHDENLPAYSDIPYPLVEENKVCGKNIDKIKAFATHSLVYQTIEEVRNAFPEFTFYPPQDIKENLYPKEMKVDELAVAIDEIIYEFDVSAYCDYGENRRENIVSVQYDLLIGEKSAYVNYLKEIVKDGGELAIKAEVLMKRLEEWLPETEKKIEPIVKILFSESEKLQSGRYYSLQDMEDRTNEALQGLKETKKESYYVQYQLFYQFDEEIKNYSGRMEIEDGFEGFLVGIRNQVEDRANDDGWKEYMKNQGEEKYQEYLQDMVDMQEKILPYLQEFVSLPEMVQNVGRVDKKANKKLSIHERLAINREKLGKKQDGKDFYKDLGEKEK